MALDRTNAQVYDAREAYIPTVFDGPADSVMDNPRSMPHRMMESIQLLPNEQVRTEHSINEQLSYFFTPIKEELLRALERDGRVLVPAGFRKTDSMTSGHNIIAEITKVDERTCRITEYNAGFDTVFTGRKVTTNEDVMTEKDGVFAQKHWTVPREALEPILDLYCHRQLHNQYCYPGITQKIDALRGACELGGETHVQDTYNCGTRTCREFARAKLPPETYGKFIAFMQSKDTQEAVRTGAMSPQKSWERAVSEMNPYSDVSHPYRG